MTGRERVRAAMRRRAVDRTPFAWGFGPTREMRQVLASWLLERGIDFEALRFQTSDSIVIDARYIGPPPAQGQSAYTSMWGIRTEDVSYGAGSYQEFVGHPLAGVEHPDQLSAIQWPELDWFDYSAARRQLDTLDPQRAKAIHLGVGSSGNPLEIYTWMTGMEETFSNLALNPELVQAALDRICRVFEGKLARLAQAVGGEIDLVHFADDLGGQQGLLISRAMYRELIQPYHRRLVRHARALLPEATMMLHSDGAVFDLIPDLIDAGFDALEAVQTDAEGMAPERLKDAYGDIFSFHGGISVQQLLPHGDAATVRHECRRLCEVLGQGGGYVAAPTHAIQAGTPPENVWAMLEGVLGNALDSLAHPAAGPALSH